MKMVHANLNKTADMSTQKCVTNLQKMASSKRITRLDVMENVKNCTQMYAEIH